MFYGDFTAFDLVRSQWRSYCLCSDRQLMVQARWLRSSASFGILLFSLRLFDLCFVIPQALEFIELSVFLCIWSIVFPLLHKGKKIWESKDYSCVQIHHLALCTDWGCAQGQELTCYTGLPALTYYWIRSICIGVGPLIRSCLSTYLLLSDWNI